MKVKVDNDLCTGCGLCPDTCPEVFAMDGDTAKVIVDTIPSEMEDKCKEAVDSCPVEAISIVAG